MVRGGLNEWGALLSKAASENKQTAKSSKQKTHAWSV